MGDDAKLEGVATNRIYLSGQAVGERVISRLQRLVTEVGPQALGMATAFLSTVGARSYDDLVRHAGVTSSRVVAGRSGSITHPSAVSYLIENGHDVRFGVPSGGIFHPKLLVGGTRFGRSGQMTSPTCGYVGSANFTGGGLGRNLEVLLATRDLQVASGVAEAFRAIWTDAERVTHARLQDYERAFARAQRRRSPEDLELLGVVDPPNGGSARTTPLVPPALGSAVWAGLQSFTGEHTFQVEFPRQAGEALRAMLRTTAGEVRIECADGEARNMTFRYYTDNGMYRLNVPNSVPLVEWARRNRSGALLVWRDGDGDSATLNAAIVRGRRLTESVERSRVLGNIGRTSTREYGWY